jgi:hypothetical protein
MAKGLADRFLGGTIDRTRRRKQGFNRKATRGLQRRVWLFSLKCAFLSFRS